MPRRAQTRRAQTRRAKTRRASPRALALAAVLAGAATATAALDGDPVRAPLAFLDRAVAAACSPADPGAKAMGAALGATLLDERRLGRAGARRRYALPGGDELVVLRQGTPDLLRHLVVELHQVVGGERPEPVAMAIAGGDCRIFHGRRMGRDQAGEIVEIVILGIGDDGTLAPTGATEPINPPVPAGRDPGGVTVALFDSGLNYTLPPFAERLARDPAGRPLGYDFWDLDARPFDNHPLASPFLPRRHGTAVASVLLAEAPETRLLPYRYPRPDMARMADMVAAAGAAGAVIVAMPMGSNRETDWQAFARAARAHPEMLFIVSAGNNGRDIDRRPVYPAVLDLENLLVVSSADGDGRPAPGSNWGPVAVDLLVPAEGLTVIAFSGAPSRGSGSSFAVTRLAALAARLLARRPAWRAAQLKQAILDLAVPAPAPPTTRHGWIPRPEALP